MEVRKFDVISVAKVMGGIYALLGFIMGAIMTLFTILGAIIGFAAGTSAGLLGIIFGIGAIIGLPIFFGIVGFIEGGIMAFIYNLVAGRIGGIKFE